MANHFVKWWKTKFLNSYKQFADGSYGKISDTEELLGPGNISTEGSQEDQLRISCSTPPIDQKSLYSNTLTEPLPPSTSHNHPQPPQSPTHTTTHQSHPPSTQQNLNFEQFSCDVSVEDGIDKRGQQRQEFSFTLYDFDGCGKITKDDIAGLVTTIYEALGSSVKVPHYGSKTIRVKLTVSPDQRKHVSATVVNQQEKTEQVKSAGTEHERTEPPSKQAESNNRCKKDLNVTIKQKSKQCRKTTSYHRRNCRFHRCCEIASNREQSECTNISDAASVISSSASGDVSSDCERDCSDYQFTCANGRKKVYRKTTTRQNPYREAVNNRQDAEKKHLRSSSLQRQELLEIIKANMNKNNLCSLKSTRKPCTSGDSAEVQRNPARNHTKPRRSHRGRIPTLQALASIMDPTGHFYVDLASFQNATQLPNSNLQYNKLIDAVMCVSNKRVSTKRVCRKHKSKVFDGWQVLTQNTNIVSNSNLNFNLANSAEKPQKRIKCNEYEYKGFRRNGKKIPQIVLGSSTSPHYLKHRNRQEDQARAMAQVVKWLEQQFSSNFYDEPTAKKSKAGVQAQNPTKPNSDSSSTHGSAIERHEHHHVHEHIHHHYYHYQDVPNVV